MPMTRMPTGGMSRITGSFLPPSRDLRCRRSEMSLVANETLSEEEVLELVRQRFGPNGVLKKDSTTFIVGLQADPKGAILVKGFGRTPQLAFEASGGSFVAYDGNAKISTEPCSRCST